MNDPNGDGARSKEADRQFYWDWLKHEESIVTTRSSFSLVAEAMLLTAVATLASRVKTQEILTQFRIPAFTLFFAGLLIILLWLFVIAKHVERTGHQIRTKLNELDTRVKELRQYTGYWRIRSHWLIGYGIPLVFLGVWVFFGLAWIW